MRTAYGDNQLVGIFFLVFVNGCLLYGSWGNTTGTFVYNVASI